MKSLYETILKTTSSGRAAYFAQNIQKVVNKVFGTFNSSNFKKFLKDNNLLLDKYDTFSIMEKLAKDNTPTNATFGEHGSKTLKDQLNNGPEDLFVMQKTGFAGYDIIIMFDIPINGWQKSSTCERIISFHTDKIYVLKVPETADLINELNKHFEKSTQCDKIEYDSRSSFSSRIGGKYLEYLFVDMKKEFV